MIRGYATGACACVAGVALLAQCDAPSKSGPFPAEAPSVDRVPPSATLEYAIPKAVIVCQPGMVDTALTVSDVPEWPGPRPSEFMEPSYPSGLCGTLAGQEAKDVYDAALQRPPALLEEGQLEKSASLSETSRALWGSAGDIVWLVVEPQW